MLAAFTLVQASAVRVSIVVPLVTLVLLEFFPDSVLSPWVSRMIAFSRSGFGSDASVSGTPFDSACQAHTRPIVTLVLPFGFIESILVLRSCDLLKAGVSGIRVTSEPQ